MSDWVKKEGENIKNEQHQKEANNHLIEVSNFWANLIRQIEKDVEAINSDEGWMSIFKGAISFNRTQTGVEIKRTSFPSAFTIYVNYLGDYVEVKSSFIKNGYDFEQERIKKSVKQYFVTTQDGKVHLKEGFSYYLVPEEASKAILSLLVTAKNYAIEFLNKET